MKLMRKSALILAFSALGILGSNCKASQFSPAQMRGFAEKRMLEAAKKGNYQEVQSILNPSVPKVVLPDHLKPLRARINAVDEHGNTIFHLAVFNDQTEFISQFGDKLGQLLTKQNDLGETPLHVALYCSRDGKSIDLILDMLKELLKNPMVGPTDGSTEAGEKVYKIIDSQDKSGNNVLHYFAKYHKPVQGAKFLQMIHKKYFLGRRGGLMFFEKYLKKANGQNKTAAELDSVYQRSKFSVAISGRPAVYKPTPFDPMDQEQWRAKPKPQIKPNFARAQ